MEIKKLLESLTELSDKKNLSAIKSLLSQENQKDIAECMEQLSADKIAVVFRMLSKDVAADVFSELSPETQEIIIHSVTDSELTAIIGDLWLDDAVDLVEEMPAGVVKRILKNAPPETRALINRFLNYPEDSAGSIMTAEFVDLKQHMSVSDAIARLRTKGKDSRSVYTCYVVSESRRLEGVITLRELLFAPDNELVGQLMNKDVITVRTAQDKEIAAKTMMKYDLITLPVVDTENRLVGIITSDDVMDVIEEEATEDFEKMAAMQPSEKPYLKTNVFALARKRIGWLLILMISGMITGGILGKFEAAFSALPLLVTFIPMITDTGGNSGSQSSTLIIRGMAVGEITPRDLPKVLWKELRVSLIVGIVLSAVNYVRLIITYPGNEGIALTVALAMLATVVLAKTAGGVLPIAAKLLHADPAIMAAPLITTIVDAVSLVCYFLIAQALLPI